MHAQMHAWEAGAAEVACYAEVDAKDGTELNVRHAGLHLEMRSITQAKVMLWNMQNLAN